MVLGTIRRSTMVFFWVEKRRGKGVLKNCSVCFTKEQAQIFYKNNSGPP
jgi:hypothetical protein